MRDGCFIAAPFVIGAVILFWLGYVVTGIVVFLPGLFTLWFFRNPERTPPDGEDSVVSPADGRVLSVEKVTENDLVSGSFYKISIFMSVFNVHVNRAPCSGTIRGIRYREGKFFSANLDKASVYNERNSVLIETPQGVPVLTIQIAGIIARRIVCWNREGDKISRGNRFGMIRFGSRLEVFLPESSGVTVGKGDIVRAGETVIGRIQ